MSLYCGMSFFTILKMFQIVCILSSLAILPSNGNPASAFLGPIEIVFLSVSGVCLVESILLASLPILIRKMRDFNPCHRFFFAGAALSVGIAVLYRTVQLDLDGVTRCQFATKRGENGDRGQVNLDPIVEPCLPFGPRLVAGILTIVSGIIYLSTGFKGTMPPSSSSLSSRRGRIFAIPEIQVNSTSISAIEIGEESRTRTN